MTGAMAEHEELEYIKPRLASIEQQMVEIREVFIPQLLKEHEEKITMEMEAGMKRIAKESYWRGFRSGGGLGVLIGLGLGIWIAD